MVKFACITSHKSFTTQAGGEVELEIKQDLTASWSVIVILWIISRECEVVIVILFSVYFPPGAVW